MVNVLRKKAKVSIAALFVLLALGTALVYTQIGTLPAPANLTPTSTPSSTPEPEPVSVEVKVTLGGACIEKSQIARKILVLNWFTLSRMKTLQLIILILHLMLVRSFGLVRKLTIQVMCSLVKDG
jgi:hypothetical protein